MISVEEALARCLGLIRPLGPETVPLRHAAGRMMTSPALAGRDQPPFAASAMDGYAVALRPDGKLTFTVIGEAGAGHGFAGTIAPGQAIRIFTGAPVPDGADRVLIQEDVDQSGDTITARQNADTATHIRAPGQDFKRGDGLAPRLLGPNDLALLAAMNMADIAVSRRPVVALIATGDELVMPGEVPRADQIIASNTFAIAALLESQGALPRLLPIARDNEASLRAVLAMADDADLIVTIGGASVGDHDLVGKVTGDLGMERAFWKIAMRPGKPLMAGLLHGKPMLGLPGNPVSAVVCTHLFVLPMVRALQSRPDVPPTTHRALLATMVDANGPRAHYMRARLAEGDGLPQIAAFDRQDSALLSVLSNADALLIRPAGDGPRAVGDVVHFLPI